MQDLKSLREKCGVSQVDLATAAEITPPTIINIETKKTQPQADVRRRCELVLNSRIDWLRTIGVPENQHAVIWETQEQELRKVLLQIAGLPENQQKHFIEVVQEYITSLVILLDEKKKRIFLLLIQWHSKGVENINQFK